MHPPFRDDLAHEIGQLLIEPDVLTQQRATWAGGQAVAIGGDGGPEISGQMGYRALIVLGCHRQAPFGSKSKLSWHLTLVV